MVFRENNMNKKLIFAVCCASLIVTACGKAEGDKQGSSTPNLFGSNNKMSINEKGVMTFQREELLPLEKYKIKNISNGFQVSSDKVAAVAEEYRDMFWAGAKLDYDALANDYLKEYRDEKDSFKRADIVNKNKENLDNIYKNASINKYQAFYVDSKQSSYDVSAGYIKSYNQEKKGFSI